MPAPKPATSPTSSRGNATPWKTASELIRAHPELVDPLRDGRLCLTTVVELARVLTTENCAAVLPRYFHLSRREAAEVSAAIQPVDRLPLRKVVTVVGAPRKAAVPTTPARDIPVAVQPREPLLRVSPPAQVSIVPLDEDPRRLHLAVSRRFLAKVGEARNALSHSHPGASTEAILLAGLELLIARHRKRRGVGAAASANPRGAAPDRITSAMKRQVWERDGGRCQWPLDGGGTCGSTVRLEFDHFVPRGLGGASDEANLRLLCRFHNQRAARQAYGNDLVDRFAVKVPRTSEPPGAWVGVVTSAAGTWR
jgi:hypothetical protein